MGSWRDSRTPVIGGLRRTDDTLILGHFRSGSARSFRQRLARHRPTER
ncbi:hypothetical protein [Salinispora arenicola]|nr:hypothetical protein [Salinispora arenicola]MCN0177321.1 hypothetical protein [Salinispora arenicola]NIL60551.1 hypothetical protein [Salinispora arenicola]